MSMYPERLQGMRPEASFNGDTKPLEDIEFGTVLVLYTGGTIGMKLNEDGVYVSEKDFLHQWLSQMPMFHDVTYAKKHQKQCKDLPFLQSFRLHPLYLPVVSGKDTKHIQYVIYEYQHLIDSSNMDSDTMLQIALDVKKFYRKFDAFIVLHGTDTMCYTAAAMSFIMENLDKPIILTGSQIPIFETRSDGRENLLGALIMAASFTVPEVCIYFSNQLLRGNRSLKASADTLEAFESPNYPPLGRLEVHVTVYWDLVQSASTTKRFNVHTQLSSHVAVLRVFPNISPSVVRAMLQDPIEGIVMQCYGAGNFPEENLELLNVLKEACDRGVIIVNTTQCHKGAVSVAYNGMKVLLDIGVVSGYDMTSEAALAKLSYVLTKHWPLAEKKQFISKNIVGEITTRDNIPQQRLLSEALSTLGLDPDMVGTAVKSLAELRDTMILPLMCLTVKHGDIEALDKICQKYPGNILTADYDRRTTLHIAIRDGSYATIKYLIKQGASVHKKDGFNKTPLQEAIYWRKFDVIELLLKSGAHLTMHPETLAIKLNKAASRGDDELITAFWKAGAKLNVWDYSCRTPLHMAVLNWRVCCVDYMLKHGANPFLADDQGTTVFGLTVHQEIIAMLESALQAERWIKFRRRHSSSKPHDIDLIDSDDTSQTSLEDKLSSVSTLLQPLEYSPTNTEPTESAEHSDQPSASNQ